MENAVEAARSPSSYRKRPCPAPPSGSSTTATRPAAAGGSMPTTTSCSIELASSSPASRAEQFAAAVATRVQQHRAWAEVHRLEDALTFTVGAVDGRRPSRHLPTSSFQIS